MNPLTDLGDLAGLMLLATAIVTTALLTSARALALARRPAAPAQSEYRHSPASQGDQARCSAAMISASGK
jgi:hypothetical protein